MAKKQIMSAAQQLSPAKEKRRSRLPVFLLVAIMLTFFVFCGWYATQRHLAFETGVFDTGVYIQPLWNFIQGRGFAVSTIEDNGPLRWATHVEPVLFLIAPLYALRPNPTTLFWLQAGALTLAAWPVYALAVRRLLGNRWAALAVVAAYFLMPATQSVALFDFHAVTLAPLFLLSAIYFLDRALEIRGKSFWLWPENPVLAESPPSTPPKAGEAESSSPQRGELERGNKIIPGSSSSRQFFATAGTHYALSGLFFLLALSTKEDISLSVFMVGAYLLLLRRRWWEGGILAVVGLLWFYVAFQMIIPAYRTGGEHSIYAAWFETLGNTPLEIALSPITAPNKVLALIFRPDTLPALLMITAPVALLPWAGLPLFALAAPSLAFSLLSQNPTLRQLETWHYAAPMLAFIMLGTIDGMARINYQLTIINEQRAKSRGAEAQRRRGAETSATRFSALAGLALILLGTSLAYHYFRGYSPLSKLYEPLEITAHHKLGREFAATIPQEAGLLAQAQLIPYAAHREKLGIWSGPLYPDYDYIWLDISHYKFPNRFDAHGDLIIGMIYEHAFGAVAYQDGYLLLKKGAPRVPLENDLFTFTEFETLPDAAQRFDAAFGDEIKLVGAEPEIRRLATSETEPQVMLYFETLQQPAADYKLFLYLLDENGTIVGATDYPQPAILWWPTARWKAGEQRRIRVNTIPWWTGDKAAFSYAIGFSRSNDPWDVQARLPVSSAGISPIDQNTLLPIAKFHRFAGLVYRGG